MAPQITDDEIDDLLYFARTGDKEELTTTLSALSEREKVSPAEILASAEDEGKSTCLHMATGNGHLDVIKYLVSQFDSRPKEQKQAFLDAGNEYANTGLHWAALGGHLDVVKFLVEQGASPALANDKNYVPLDLAMLNEKTAVADYFLEEVRRLEADNGADGLGGAVAGVKLEDGAGGEGEEEEEDVKLVAGSAAEGSGSK